MPFSFDIALLESGEMKIIEANPGGNSGFIASSKVSIQALNNDLRDTPVSLQRSLPLRDQMGLADSLFKSVGGTFSSEFPDFVLDKNLKLFDQRYEQIKAPEPIRAMFPPDVSKLLCRRLFQ